MISFATLTLATTTICLSLTVAQILDDLFVVIYPSTAKDSGRKLTCVATDKSDAALIWNYDLAVNGVKIADFHPNKLRSDNSPECKDWRRQDCFLKWAKTKDWKKMKSIGKPMGPVFDYRWEGFEEYGFNSSALESLQTVNSSGNLAFSVRGSKKLGLFLCGQDQGKSPCIWFSIETNNFAILASDKKPAGLNTPLKEWNDITIQSKQTNFTNILDPYEWQTYRIKWNKNEVKVFDNNNDTPILRGNHPYNLSEVLMGGLETRIRFHNYTYYRTNKGNVQMSTSQFKVTDEDFCIDIIIGLCSACKLKVSLIETTNGEETEDHLETISGDKNSEHDGLLAWRPVKLHKSFQSAKQRLLKLRITTVLDRGETGRWAVDLISRKCAPNGQHRESTIKIPRRESHDGNTTWPTVKCQKLFYDKNVSVIVDPWSKRPYKNVLQLEKFIRDRPSALGIECRDSVESCSICDSNGCTCTEGHNCTGQCSTSSEIVQNCDLRCRKPQIDGSQKLTSKHLDHGVVIFNWKHPMYNDRLIGVNKFRFDIQLLHTDLLYDIYQHPITQEYDVQQERHAYQKEFRLAASSRYKVSVTSVSHCNIDIAQQTMDVSVGSDIGFGSGEKPEVKCNGTDIKLTLPAVVNATRNTTIQVDFSKCNPYQSQRTSENQWNPEYPVTNNQPVSIVVRDNRIAESSEKCSELLAENCEIELTAHDWISGTPIVIWRLENRTEGFGMWYLLSIIPLVLVFLAMLMVLRVVWRRRSRRNIRKTTSIDDFDFIPLSESQQTIVNSKLFLTSKPPSHTSATNRTSENEYSVAQEFNSNSVDLKFFEANTRNAITNGKLNSQFMILPGGLTKSCEYGRLPENIPKNRNRNVIAYDDTRVKLQKIPGDPYSDYINANYVKGYRNEKGYIATQGPTPNTVNDFWRMVWQEKVHVICMLTNLVENGQTKCEQYWPPVGMKIKYGDVAVTTLSHEVFADYTFRALRVSSEKLKRRVMHLHYTGWPADGIPAYCQSLVAYLKKLQTTDLKYGPVLVHCSDGDGRTGTLILCDICLSGAIGMGRIDVSAVLSRIRDSRADMVKNLSQYLLAHIIMVESIVSLPTQIPCDEDLPNGIKKLRLQLTTDVQRLNDTVWQERTLQSLAATPEKSETDELSHELSDELFMGFERTASFNRNVNHRIDAVPVDGVKMKRQYLASWLPSTSNVSNFWKSITEMEIELIVVLQRPDPNDTTCRNVKPSETNLATLIPYLRIEPQESETSNDGHYTIEKYRLTDILEEEARPQFVTVVTCTGWGYGRNGNPPRPEALVSLWRASERIPRKEGPTLVLCHNGVTACGLYLAMSFLLERMTVERDCDVISAIRAVRRSRRQFVQSMDQIEYLYDAALNYYESFATYANFS